INTQNGVVTPSLAVGDVYAATTAGDGTTLTITSINATSGTVGFSLAHQYRNDGPAPGNNTASDVSTVSVTVSDQDLGQNTATTAVTVNNVAPVLSNVAITPTIN